MRELRRVTPPFIYAEDLQAAYEEIVRLGKMYVEGGDLIDNGGGRTLKIPKPPEEFYARVWAATGSSGEPIVIGSSGEFPKPYDWIEQRPTADGGWEDKPGGLQSGQGSNTWAFEFNDNDTPDNSKVWLRPGALWWETVAGGSSGSSGGSSGGTETLVWKDWRFAYEPDNGPGGGSGGGGSSCTDFCKPIQVVDPAYGAITQYMHFTNGCVEINDTPCPFDCRFGCDGVEDPENPAFPSSFSVTIDSILTTNGPGPNAGDIITGALSRGGVYTGEWTGYQAGEFQEADDFASGEELYPARWALGVSVKIACGTMTQPFYPPTGSGGTPYYLVGLYIEVSLLYEVDFGDGAGYVSHTGPGVPVIDPSIIPPIIYSAIPGNYYEINNAPTRTCPAQQWTHTGRNLSAVISMGPEA